MSNVAVTNGKSVYVKAMAFAAKGGVALNSILSKVADDKERAGAAVFVVYDWIKTNMSDAEIEGLPVPGSKATETNNPDKWTDKVVKDGQSKDVPRSFYADVFDGLAMGKEIKETIEGLDKVKNGAADAPDHLKVMTMDDRRVLRDRMNNRRKYGKAALVQAVQILQQGAKFAEMENIGLKLLRDKDNAVRLTPKPIKIFDAANPEDLEMYSVSTFLSLKPDTAALKGGTMEAIRSTIGRSARGPQENGITIKSAADFDSALGSLANFLKDVGETRGPKRTAFLKHLNEAGSDTLLKSMQYTYECLDHYLGLPEIAKRVETLDLSDDSDDDNATEEQHVA